jgi:signal transduction histidine kinase
VLSLYVLLKYKKKRGLTRELHDQVGQPLTALSINLDYLLEQLSGKSETSIITSLYDSKALVKKIMALIRDIIAYLRPQILDDYGLEASIRWFSERFSQRTKIPIVFKGGGIKQRLPRDVETNLFRIVQESLTNISKYANAGKATIAMKDSEEKVRLTISDDGLGFDPSNTERKGLGLLGMRERVEAIGGELRVESSPGKGTRVTVEVKR